MFNTVFVQFIIPLKIYNGTPEGRLIRDSMATLPINELGFRNAKPIRVSQRETNWATPPIGHKGILRIPESPQLNGNPPLEDCPISTQ